MQDVILKNSLVKEHCIKMQRIHFTVCLMGVNPQAQSILIKEELIYNRCRYY